MDERALRLASHAAVARVAGKTEAVVRAWAERWGIEQGLARVEACVWTAAGRPEPVAIGRWQDTVEPVRATFFWADALEAAVTDVLYPRSAGEPSPRQDSLARSGSRHATADLRRMLCEQWTGTTDLSDADDSWVISRWDAPIRVDLALGGVVTITAIVPAPVAARTTAVSAQRLKPLEASAFRSLPVRAELVVGRADVALPEVLALQVNDVIVLDSLVSDPLELQVHGVDQVLQACLGQVGGRRALQIVFSSPKRGVSS